MIREPALEVIEEINARFNHKTKEALETRGFLYSTFIHYTLLIDCIAGIRGSGKSACLATVVHHAYKKEYLVFYIPSGYYWTHGIHYAEPSTLLKGYYDVPIPTYVCAIYLFLTNILVRDS